MPKSKNRRKNGKKLKQQKSTKKTNDLPFCPSSGSGVIYFDKDTITPLGDLYSYLQDFPLYFRDDNSRFKKLVAYVVDKTPIIIKSWETWKESGFAKDADTLCFQCHNGVHSKLDNGQAGVEITLQKKAHIIASVGWQDPLSKSLKDNLSTDQFACVVFDSFGNFSTFYLQRINLQDRFDQERNL